MKKGPAITVVFGLVLLAFLYFSPVVPKAETPVVEAEAKEEISQSEPTPDEIVEQALEELRSGTTPPMQAILKIRKVAEDYPGNVKANFTLGLLSMQTAQYDKAITRFLTVTENSPDDVDAHRLLAQAYLNSGDTTTAMNTYKKALNMAEGATKTEIEEEIKNLPAIN